LAVAAWARWRNLPIEAANVNGMRAGFPTLICVITVAEEISEFSEKTYEKIKRNFHEVCAIPGTSQKSGESCCPLATRYIWTTDLSIQIEITPSILGGAFFASNKEEDCQAFRLKFDLPYSVVGKSDHSQ